MFICQRRSKAVHRRNAVSFHHTRWSLSENVVATIFSLASIFTPAALCRWTNSDNNNSNNGRETLWKMAANGSWSSSGVRSSKTSAVSLTSGRTLTNMRTAMNSEQIGSAMFQPNVWISSVDKMTPTLPSVSASTCRNTPVSTHTPVLTFHLAETHLYPHTHLYWFFTWQKHTCIHTHTCIDFSPGRNTPGSTHTPVLTFHLAETHLYPHTHLYWFFTWQKHTCIHTHTPVLTFHLAETHLTLKSVLLTCQLHTRHRHCHCQLTATPRPYSRLSQHTGSERVKMVPTIYLTGHA